MTGPVILLDNQPKQVYIKYSNYTVLQLNI